MLDRTASPAFGKIERIDLMGPAVHHLDNGIPLYSIEGGAQDVVKIDLVFAAGTASFSRMLVANATLKMLSAGTSSQTAAQIAETLDFYGASLEKKVSNIESSLSLFTLGKHLIPTLSTLGQICSDPIFPEKELETFKRKGRQTMMVNQQKVDYLGSLAFRAALFGAHSPFGRSADLQDYDLFSRQELTEFYAARIKGSIQHIIVAGRPTNETFSEINRHFGQEERRSQAATGQAYESPEAAHVHIGQPDAVQTSITIGRQMFSRTHPDFIGMNILSTVLGGYFGSRLMTNIREDKGYTYGIGAGMSSVLDTGYLTISTEVGSEVSEPALKEIYAEIARLREDLIPSDELELVRNYLLGHVLKSIDGPFSVARIWKNYLRLGIGKAAHQAFVDEIRTISAERLRELAQRYLQKDSLVQVTVGP